MRLPRYVLLLAVASAALLYYAPTLSSNLTQPAPASAASVPIVKRQRSISLPPPPRRLSTPHATTPLPTSTQTDRTRERSDDESQRTGQSEQALRSVRLAIERQRPPPAQGGVLWGSVQASEAQFEKESANVRALLQADGMPSWRPDPALLPPQKPSHASMDELLEAVPRGGNVWLAFGNSGVTEMLLNWAHHVLRLGHGKAMVIAAFDEPLLLALRSLQLPSYIA